MNDPAITCYVAIKSPKTYIQYGGVVVAPIVKNILSQSFSILNIKKQDGGYKINPRYYVDRFSYSVLDYTGKSRKEITMHPFYKLVIIGNGDKIIDQNPKYGDVIYEGESVYLYTN